LSSSASSRLLALFCLVLSSSAMAFTPPRVGQQYLTLGLTSEPGFLFDDSAPNDAGFSPSSVVWSQRVRFGLQHAVHTHFYAAAEFELGGSFFNEHTANAIGKAASEKAFSWQAGLVGRFLPAGDAGGFHFGGGLSALRVSLDDAPLLVLGFDLRTGLYLWRGESFGLLEVGYVMPFIQGLSYGTDFGGTAERKTREWSLHRGFVSLNVGF
jgi:hypothetical protein